MTESGNSEIDGQTLRVSYSVLSRRAGYVDGDQPCESGSARRRLIGWNLGGLAREVGHAAGDVFDIEFKYFPEEGSRKRPLSRTHRGVLCSDGSFELLEGPHSDNFVSSEYLATTLGASLRRIGYNEGGYIVLPVEISPKTIDRMEGQEILGRTGGPRLLKCGP